jgi:hypothetical protein
MVKVKGRDNFEDCIDVRIDSLPHGTQVELLRRASLELVVRTSQVLDSDCYTGGADPDYLG